MLTIREEQKLTLLEEAAPRLLETRIGRLCSTVAHVYPEVCESLSEQQLLAWVQYALSVAAEHGIKEFDNQARYVHLTFLGANRCLEGSAAHPWVGKILAWPDAEEQLKLAALEKRADREFNQ